MVFISVNTAAVEIRSVSPISVSKRLTLLFIFADSVPMFIVLLLVASIFISMFLNLSSSPANTTLRSCFFPAIFSVLASTLAVLVLILSVFLFTPSIATFMFSQTWHFDRLNSQTLCSWYISFDRMNSQTLCSWYISFNDSTVSFKQNVGHDWKVEWRCFVIQTRQK